MKSDTWNDFPILQLLPDVQSLIRSEKANRQTPPQQKNNSNITNHNDAKYVRNLYTYTSAHGQIRNANIAAEARISHLANKV